MPEGADAADAWSRASLDRLAGAIGALYRDAVGSAPTLVDVAAVADAVVLAVEGTLGPLERTLIAAGSSELVARERLQLREVMREALTERVQAALQVDVTAVAGEFDIGLDLETIVCSLAQPGQVAELQADLGLLPAPAPGAASPSRKTSTA